MFSISTFRYREWAGILLLGVIVTIAGQAGATPDDAALVAGDYTITSTIPFDRSNKHWLGTVSNFYVRIEENNSTFVKDHASTKGLASNGDDNAIAHFHARWDYGTTGAPSIGAQSWPTKAEGNSFWDWAYTGSGSRVTDIPKDADTDRNCVTYAFGDDTPFDRADVEFWVNTTWTDYELLWEKATPTWICPVNGSDDDTGDCGATDIDDDDIAGVEAPDNHVWRLWAAANTCTAATGLRWENNTSGVYVFHPSPASNDGIAASITASATPGNPREIVSQSNPLIGTFRIKR